MKKIIFLFFLLNNTFLFSQTFNKTVGIYSTELDQKELRGKSHQAKAVLNTNTGLLTVTDNLSAIKLDDLKFDTLNKNENPIFFKFETTIQKNISIILKENQNSNLIRIEGTITINGISRESVALWSPIQLITTSNTILIDFEIKFLCEDFNLADLKFPFTNLVEFEIEDGILNKVE